MYIYREVAKILQRVPVNPLLTLPTVNIVHYHGTFVKTRKPTLAPYYQLNSRLHMSFTSFSTNASFCSRTNRERHRYMGCHISCGSSGLWQLLSLSLFFMTLTVLRSTGLIPCRMFPNLGVSDIFPMIRLGLCDFGKNSAEVKCPSRRILIRAYVIFP